MQKLIKKFHQLTEREQILVVISAIVVVIGAFYWMVWSPLNASLEMNRVTVTNKKADLIWLKKNTAKAIQLRKSVGAAKPFTGSLPQAVNQTASRVNIAISRMQPQGDALKVWVDQAPFNDVLSWLQALESRGIKIIDLDLAESDAPGQIKIRSLQLGKV